MTAQAFSGQCRARVSTRYNQLNPAFRCGMRVYRAPVTVARSLRRRGLSWVTRPGMRPWDATKGSGSPADALTAVMCPERLVVPDRVDFHVPGAVEHQVAAPGLRQRDPVQVPAASIE